MADFLRRLRQHKLVQWAIAYVAFAFALIQVVDVVADSYDWPHLVMHLVFGLLVLGFVVAMLLAWYHGERGAQRVSGPELLLIALALAIGGGLLWHFGQNGASPIAAQVAATAQLTQGLHVGTARGPAPAPAPSHTDTASAAAALLGTQPIPAESIAVLPLVNESGDPKQQYFSDGLSEDLITALSQFAGLKVISRHSSFEFRHSTDSNALIGRKLGVAHLLEGSVQRIGDTVRISAELVNAADSSILWSQHYDRPYKDLFKLQDAITKAVAGALKAKLLTAPGAVLQSDRPPSGSLAAYTAYLHGVDDFNMDTQQAYRRAIVAFEQAARLDPTYAAAWARLSMTWSWLAGSYLGGARARHAYAKANTAANTALSLDANLALAHQARALYLGVADLDWSGAATAARRALQLAPNDAYATFSLAANLATLGKVERAVTLNRRALQGDPRQAGWHNWLAGYLAALGKLDEAAQAAQTAMALRPEGSSFAERLAFIEVLRGDAHAALAAARQEPPGPWHAVAMALALQIGANRKSADAALNKLIADYASVAAYQIAEVYALRKDPDETFKWLDRAWTDRDPGIDHLLFDPLILTYRRDPRFAAYCKKVGLPTTTDAVTLKP